MKEARNLSRNFIRTANMAGQYGNDESPCLVSNNHSRVMKLVRYMRSNGTNSNSASSNKHDCTRLMEYFPSPLCQRAINRPHTITRESLRSKNFTAEKSCYLQRKFHAPLSECCYDGIHVRNFYRKASILRRRCHLGNHRQELSQSS